eukprot:4431923-Pyramimonas_sp.AAC.1
MAQAAPQHSASSASLQPMQSPRRSRASCPRWLARRRARALGHVSGLALAVACASSALLLVPVIALVLFVGFVLGLVLAFARVLVGVRALAFAPVL